MVRIATSPLLLWPCSPHVRGDGPPVIIPPPAPRLFSPRAWGWSSISPLRPCSGCVLPTCVGMVRPCCQPITLCASSPHVRGDGPNPSGRHGQTRPFSPRAWGWSASTDILCLRHPVLPTCVGMVRQKLTGVTLGGRSPHVRGDGPPQGANAKAGNKFSPRAWGWSE